jgi:hypothetical protein
VVSGQLAPFGLGDPGVDLDDAREALAYWEDRERRLPRRAIRQRREAAEMTRRWRVRVTAAERGRYGRGMLGALALFAAEGRLPETARQTGRALARGSRRAALVMAAMTVAVMLAMLAALVALIAALV